MKPGACPVSPPTPSAARAATKADWSVAFELLDTGLELDRAEHTAWLAALPPQQAHLGPLLRELLHTHAAQHGLGLRARIELLLQVARAVTHAHAQRVVRRDLKPSNILVDAQDQPHLLDFGIALTPNYTSPEQIRGDAVGTASDIYSLGVVAYELLAGARPYHLPRDVGPVAQDMQRHLHPHSVLLMVERAQASALGRADRPRDAATALCQVLADQAAETHERPTGGAASACHFRRIAS